jgi:hypothetical protein
VLPEELCTIVKNCIEVLQKIFKKGKGKESDKYFAFSVFLWNYKNPYSYSLISSKAAISTWKPPKERRW